MILVDTSVWVRHFRTGDPDLEAMLGRGQVLAHPFVVGELALGDLRPRQSVLRELNRLPSVIAAAHAEVLAFIEAERLFALGIGYVDAHLLAAVRLTPGSSLWTRDRRLGEAASSLGVAWAP